MLHGFSTMRQQPPLHLAHIVIPENSGSQVWGLGFGLQVYHRYDLRTKDMVCTADAQSVCARLHGLAHINFVRLSFPHKVQSIHQATLLHLIL